MNDCPQRPIDINRVSENDTLDSDSGFTIDNVEGNVEHNQAFININPGPNYKEVKFKIDTGSHVGILSGTVYIDLAPYYPLSKCKIQLFAYNGHSAHLICYSVIQSNLWVENMKYTHALIEY